MSLAVEQAEARTHRPPWQFRAQQSAAAVHVSPRFLQVVLGIWAHFPAVHTPEQQSPGAAQALSMVAHIPPTHLPPAQVSEQHSVAEAQEDASAPQSVDAPQTDAPASLDRHAPEQQTGGCAALHVAPEARHAGTPPSPPPAPVSPLPEGVSLQLQPHRARARATTGAETEPTRESMWILLASRRPERPDVTTGQTN
jgi:hypothetical protein